MILRIGRGCSTLKQVLFVPKKSNFISRDFGSVTNCCSSQIIKKCHWGNSITNEQLILIKQNYMSKYFYSSEKISGSLDRLEFINICSETLDSLSEYFEELIESVPHLKNADVTYSDGVLTVSFGQKYGTYVINRQTPNLQIWLSSPMSGPKRYDYSGGTWVYRHDNTTLHSLLDKEIKEIANQEVEFVGKCLHAKLKI